MIPPPPPPPKGRIPTRNRNFEHATSHTQIIPSSPLAPLPFIFSPSTGEPQGELYNKGAPDAKDLVESLAGGKWKEIEGGGKDSEGNRTPAKAEATVAGTTTDTKKAAGDGKGKAPGSRTQNDQMKIDIGAVFRANGETVPAEEAAKYFPDLKRVDDGEKKEDEEKKEEEKEEERSMHSPAIFNEKLLTNFQEVTIAGAAGLRESVRLYRAESQQLRDAVDKTPMPAKDVPGEASQLLAEMLGYDDDDLRSSINGLASLCDSKVGGSVISETLLGIVRPLSVLCINADAIRAAVRNKNPVLCDGKLWRSFGGNHQKMEGKLCCFVLG